MTQRLFIFFSFLASLLAPEKTFAQCNEKLIETAIKNAGSNTLFVRDFKLKNDKKKAKLFMPVANYEVRLNENYLYRFTVVSENTKENAAILQLFDENLQLGSTFNPEKGISDTFFDFYCTESKDYTVNLSFKENNKGCAVGVLSIVLSDTTDIKKIENELKTDNILYTGIDNYLSIASDLPDMQLEVSIDIGTISQDKGFYKVNVDQAGKAVVTITSRDTTGRITETSQVDFLVTDALPLAKLCGKSGGLISLNELTYSSAKLELDDFGNEKKYIIVEFTVCERFHETGYTSSGDDALNSRQIKLLKNLKSGDAFYIKDIIIVNEKGFKYKIEPLGFIIE
jgi:hypothetical protein